MKVKVYARISDEKQEDDEEYWDWIVKNNLEMQVVVENGVCFVTCHRCGHSWAYSPYSKWAKYADIKVLDNKYHVGPKCPFCD